MDSLASGRDANIIKTALFLTIFSTCTHHDHTNTDPIYTMGRSEGETERLISQSLLYEGITLRFFREAGIAPGMKVLDVGSGAETCRWPLPEWSARKAM